MIQENEEKQTQGQEQGDSAHQNEADTSYDTPAGEDTKGEDKTGETAPVEAEHPSPEPSEPEAAADEASATEEQPVEVAVASAAKAEEEAAAKKTRVARARAGELTTLPDEQTAQKKWYVIHAHSGHENKVRQSLDARVKQEHLEELVSQIIVPSEEVAEVKGGKKRITSRKIFPGYVLVEMKLTHRTWQLIRTTAGVTGFIGSGKMPSSLEPDEIESIFQQMRGEKKKPKPKVSFEKEEKVKIIEGPFTNFMGYVDEVNPERGKLKVMVEIFERLTSVELEFWQVEKA
ncbi:transcription termination/antitermination factor NusG [Candidatus Poribacteria bacterium]|nr:transcription termination/antitermination factor NusG [Candidatus Poribacteria bacterium]